MTTHDAEPQEAIDLQVIADAVIDLDDGWWKYKHDAGLGEFAGVCRTAAASWHLEFWEDGSIRLWEIPNSRPEWGDEPHLAADILDPINRRAIEAIWAALDAARLATHDQSDPSEGE